ncbi:reverse transcriptase [Halobacteriovorax marinus SJ]|uniref:RNA-directed DNA polymerase n=1 Tax=Halobacteriovorax marinus (strain ATCC BAA-682 / DSM 15412 / SJ) TaxID=862908 RepID=E1X5W3_HALMS|nr:retron St85 family RNA-directed DNA polymerase [Halobacteriovorax marinus]CBW25680.1 reverse transcriptase [Halobacteriovorax marinus SJ]
MIYREISKFYNIPQEEVQDFISSNKTKYFRFEIPKRNGKFRTITHPRHELKIVQYWLVEKVFSRMNYVSCSSYAYIKERDILKNARKHQRNSHFLSVDFSNFFESITFKLLEPFLEKFYHSTEVEYSLEELKNVVKRSCFDSYGRLPVGFVTSSIISNIVMFDFDLRINVLLMSRKMLGRVVYTRYADDVTISTNKEGAIREIYELFCKGLISEFNSEITLNASKTKVRHKRCGNVLVTGLRITKDSRITIHKNYKERVKKLIHDNYKSEDLSVVSRIIGHLNFIKYVDANYSHKLNIKYFSEINELKLRYQALFSAKSYI